MELQERVINQFHEHMGCAAYSAEHLPQDIAIAAQMLHQCFIQEGKVLICGNGANAANGHHFSAALLSRFRQERPSLPAFNLAADSTTMSAVIRDSSFQDVFAKQITALGQQGDIVFQSELLMNLDEFLVHLALKKYLSHFQILQNLTSEFLFDYKQNQNT